MAPYEAVSLAIAALGEDAFYATYWDRQYALVRQSESTFTGHGALLAGISEYLDRTDIRYPSLRLVSDGKEVSLDEYTRELRLGPHLSHDWVVNEQVFAHYNDGGTIVLQMLQDSVPAFAVPAVRLERRFGANVQLSAFITPPSAQGFTAHYDTYGFFAVQLHGTKTWQLFDRTPLLPVRDDRASEETWNSVPATAEFTLAEGDVLYVPRGLYHAARTSRDASVHMTIGIFSPNWVDVVRDCIAELQALPEMRDALPFDPEQHVGEVLSVINSELRVKSGIARTHERIFQRHVDTRRGRMRDLLDLPAAGPVRAERQPVAFELVKSQDACILRFAGKDLSFPAFTEPAIEFVTVAEGSFDSSALLDVLDEPSAVDFLTLLVREGFLRLTN